MMTNRQRERISGLNSIKWREVCLEVMVAIPICKQYAVNSWNMYLCWFPRVYRTGTQLPIYWIWKSKRLEEHLLQHWYIETLWLLITAMVESSSEIGTPDTTPLKVAIKTALNWFWIMFVSFGKEPLDTCVTCLFPNCGIIAKHWAGRN